MPPRPPAGSSRPTLRKYYSSTTQDAALATFLAARNRQDHSDNARSEPQIAAESEDEPDARRVRRRTEGNDTYVYSLVI